MFKGKTEIILTDVKTGEVERYEEENMLTGALNSVYKGNPYGLLSHGHNLNTRNDYRGTHDYNLMNTTGGVLLFPNAIVEDASHLYEPLSHQPTAYASNDAYDGEDSKRGSYSPRESIPTPNGFQYVWNFSTAQGNGQISCICLTHVKGAKTYANDYLDLINYAQINQNNNICYGELGFLETPVNKIKFKYVLAYNDEQLVMLDRNNGLGTLKANARKLTYESFATSADYDLKKASPACNFIADGAEYYEITATATTITWTKYNIDGDQIGSGSWGFSGTDFYRANNRYLFAKVGNYIYIPNTALSGVYKCNIVNSADVTFIAGSCPAGSYGDVLRNIDGQVFTHKGIITDSNAFITSVGQLELLPFRRIGVWLLGYADIYFTGGGAYSGGVNSLGRQLQTNYLATINNLNQTVNKTSDKTMKIVYTLTEVNS